MTLHRFFVDPAKMAGDRFPLPAAIERQVRAVLRLRDGDRLVLLPNDGAEAICPPLALETLAQGVGHLLFVFDDQHTHRP